MSMFAYTESWSFASNSGSFFEAIHENEWVVSVTVMVVMMLAWSKLQCQFVSFFIHFMTIAKKQVRYISSTWVWVSLAKKKTSLPSCRFHSHSVSLNPDLPCGLLEPVNVEGYSADGFVADESLVPDRHMNFQRRDAHRDMVRAADVKALRS